MSDLSSCIDVVGHGCVVFDYNLDSCKASSRIQEQLRNQHPYLSIMPASASPPHSNTSRIARQSNLRGFQRRIPRNHRFLIVPERFRIPFTFRWRCSSSLTPWPPMRRSPASTSRSSFLIFNWTLRPVKRTLLNACSRGSAYSDKSGNDPVSGRKLGAFARDIMPNDLVVDGAVGLVISHILDS